MSFMLRSATPSDAPVAGRICHDAFKAIAEQHGYPPDFPSAEVAIGLFDHLISRADVHSVIAEVGGRVVGSNFLWEDENVAGVGPITVEPGQQNAAVGRRLMEAVLERARQQRIAAVRLVQAAYHTRSLSLYTKLGFITREPLVVMQGATLKTSVAGHVVRAAHSRDAEAVNALCHRVHGHHRAGEVRAAIQQGNATVVEFDHRVVGYSTGVGFFGHTVGESVDALKALIAGAPAFGGPGFLLPIRNAPLFRWCLEHKLRVVMPMTLMSIGPYNEPQGSFLPSILY
ncbi:MAG TPA: GNAT family N-acetyltransferase [Opitutaceae bacterium]|nr:GNAT family N-acetyltransferase [Opitutaceae bacterium]